MKDKSFLAQIALHTSALVFLVAGIFYSFTTLNETAIKELSKESVLMLGVNFTVIILIEVIAVGLFSKKKWAWTSSLVLFVIYTFSPFILLGVLGLVGLLLKGTREHYGINGVIDVWAGKGPKKELDQPESEEKEDNENTTERLPKPAEEDGNKAG